MQFFLDENIPKNVSLFLKQSGSSVFDIRGSLKEGASDTEIFKLAQEKSSIFITTDKDFFHTIPFLFSDHFGVIVIALSQPNSKNILDKVKYAVEYLKNVSIQSKCLLLSDKKMSLAITKKSS